MTFSSHVHGASKENWLFNFFELLLNCVACDTSGLCFLLPGLHAFLAVGATSGFEGPSPSLLSPGQPFVSVRVAFNDAFCFRRIEF
eukprot:2563352-Rhodomonas_salina.2